MPSKKCEAEAVQKWRVYSGSVTAVGAAAEERTGVVVAEGQG
jgi:hypothetical protein